jgi:hypothetical protein
MLNECRRRPWQTTPEQEIFPKITRSLGRLERLVVVYQYSSAHCSRAEEVDNGELISGAGSLFTVTPNSLSVHRMVVVSCHPSAL